jgi:hypothetical protein
VVAEELSAAQAAVGHTARVAASDPTILHGYEIRPRHLQRCLVNLDSTYVVRLFAVFEAVLREYWQLSRRKGKLSNVAVSRLIEQVATRLDVPNSIVRTIHEIRAYRNCIVHEHLSAPPMDLRGCQSAISYFLSFLPPQF